MLPTQQRIEENLFGEELSTERKGKRANLKYTSGQK